MLATRRGHDRDEAQRARTTTGARIGTDLDGVGLTRRSREAQLRLQSAGVVVARQSGARRATRTLVHGELGVRRRTAHADLVLVRGRSRPGEPEVVVDHRAAEEQARAVVLTFAAGRGERGVHSVRAVAHEDRRRRACIVTAGAGSRTHLEGAARASSAAERVEADLQRVDLTGHGVEAHFRSQGALVVVARDGRRGRAAATGVDRDLGVVGRAGAEREDHLAGRRGRPGVPDVRSDGRRAEEQARGFVLAFRAGRGREVVEGERAEAAHRDGCVAAIVHRRCADIDRQRARTGGGAVVGTHFEEEVLTCGDREGQLRLQTARVVIARHLRGRASTRGDARAIPHGQGRVVGRGAADRQGGNARGRSRPAVPQVGADRSAGARREACGGTRVVVVEGAGARQCDGRAAVVIARGHGDADIDSADVAGAAVERANLDEVRLTGRHGVAHARLEAAGVVIARQLDRRAGACRHARAIPERQDRVVADEAAGLDGGHTAGGRGPVEPHIGAHQTARCGRSTRGGESRVDRELTDARDGVGCLGRRAIVATAHQRRGQRDGTDRERGLRRLLDDGLDVLRRRALVGCTLRGRELCLADAGEGDRHTADCEQRDAHRGSRERVGGCAPSARERSTRTKQLLPEMGALAPLKVRQKFPDGASGWKKIAEFPTVWLHAALNMSGFFCVGALASALQMSQGPLKRSKPRSARLRGLPESQVGSDHGFQVIVYPLVKLKVAAVQKAAALRYHTW